MKTPVKITGGQAAIQTDMSRVLLLKGRFAFDHYTLRWGFPNPSSSQEQSLIGGERDWLHIKMAQDTLSNIRDIKGSRTLRLCVTECYREVVVTEYYMTKVHTEHFTGKLVCSRLI
jgi:hypothetical protein